MANRPSKNQAIFEEVKRVEGLGLLIKEIRGYLRLDEFKKQGVFQNLDDFFEAQKIETKYLPKSWFLRQNKMDYDIQTMTHAVHFLIEKFKLPEKYFKMIWHLILDKESSDYEIYNSNEFFISHLQRADHEVERFNSENVGKSYTQNAEENFLQMETLRGLVEELDNAENFICPIFIKISPFTNKEEFLTDLRKEWKTKIVPIQDRYKQNYRWQIEKVRGKDSEVEFVNDIIYNLNKEGKSVKEIVEKVNDFYYNKYDELEHFKTRDIKNVIKRQNQKRL